MLLLLATARSAAHTIATVIIITTPINIIIVVVIIVIVINIAFHPALAQRCIDVIHTALVATAGVHCCCLLLLLLLRPIISRCIAHGEAVVRARA